MLRSTIHLPPIEEGEFLLCYVKTINHFWHKKSSLSNVNTVMLFLYEMTPDYLLYYTAAFPLLLMPSKYLLYIAEQFPLYYHQQLIQLLHHNCAVIHLYFYFL